MMKSSQIDAFSFGRMTVGGRVFTSDLVIHPDGRIQDHWWRAEGHNLLPGDIAAVLEADPDKLVIGTGDSDRMSVSEDLVELCRKRGIDVEACPTAVAVTRFNDAVSSGTVVAGCFHLTC